MPSIVSINSAASSDEVTEGAEARLGFDVANTSGRSLKLRVRLLGGNGADLPGWLNISEGSELQLAAAETARVEVSATPKAGAAGAYQIRLEVFEIALPEENVDRSAPVTLTVTPAAVPEPEPGGRPRWMIPALVAGLVAIALIGGLAWWLLRDPGQPEPDVALMPDLVGMTPEEVQTAMAESPAEEIRLETVPPEDATPGRVARQSPPAGSDPTGTIVVVGIAGAEVPEVTNVKLETALTRLIDAKLKLGNRATRDTSDRGQDLTVIASNPRPGALVDPGSPVDLTTLVFRQGGTPPRGVDTIFGRIPADILEQVQSSQSIAIPQGTMRMQDFQNRTLVNPGN